MPIQCEACGRHFLNNAAMERHESLKTADRPECPNDAMLRNNLGLQNDGYSTLRGVVDDVWYTKREEVEEA